MFYFFTISILTLQINKKILAIKLSEITKEIDLLEERKNQEKHKS